MAEQTDLFGFSPAQGSLFGTDDDRLQVPRQATEPDPDEIRNRLSLLLETARGATTMPWPERDARMWQIVFPNMAKWLPASEAEQLTFAFAQEIERLKAA